MRRFTVPGLGLIAYAAIGALGFVLEGGARVLWAHQAHAGEASEPSAALSIMQSVLLAKGPALAISLLAMARLPSPARVRSLALAGAGLAGFGSLFDLGRTFLPIPVASVESFVRLVKLTTATSVVLALAVSVLFALIVARLGRATSTPRLGHLAMAQGAAAGVPAALRLAVLAGVQIEPLASINTASSGIAAALLIPIAFLALRAEGPLASPLSARARTLDPQWRSVRSAIIGCVLVLAARALFAVLLTVANGSLPAPESSALLSPSVLLTCALLSQLLGLLMIAAVFRIARAPTAGAGTPATRAMVLMLLGLAADGLWTFIALRALDSPPVALFAERALPVLSVAQTVLATGAGAFLLQALGHIAAALHLSEEAGRALGTIKLLVIAGSGTALILPLLGVLPVTVMLLLVVGLLCLLAPIAGRIIGLSFSLAQEIDART